MRSGILLILFLLGCGSSGPSRPQADKEAAKTALIKALDSWKANQNVKDLSFSDDWRKQLTLSEYTIGDATVPDERTISFAVTLKLKDKKGKEETRVTSYLVELSNPIRVTRDPYN